MSPALAVDPQRIREVWVCAGPKAGTGEGRDQIPKLGSLVAATGASFRVTDSVPELRSRLAEERDRRQESIPPGDLVLIAAGGDGTMALVAGLAPSDVPILPMPLGTENLLARHFGYSADAERVFETLTNGRDRQLDAGLAGDRLFLVVASAGFDAEVVRAAHLRRRGHIRRCHYASPILRGLRRYRFPEIEMRWELGDGHANQDGDANESAMGGAGPGPGSPLQGGTLRGRWGMAFNLPRYGGWLTIEPDAVGDDGRLDLIVFNRGSVLSGFRYLWGVASGRHLRYPDVSRQRVRRVVLTSTARVPYQLDGDYVGHLPVTIECLPGRVRLRLPPPT